MKTTYTESNTTDDKEVSKRILCFDHRGSMYLCYEDLLPHMLPHWPSYGSIDLNPDESDKLVMVYGPFQTPGLFGCVDTINSRATKLISNLLGEGYGSIYGTAFVMQMKVEEGRSTAVYLSADSANRIFDALDMTLRAEPETKEPKTKEPKTKEPETKEPETKEPETKEPETKEPETKEPETKEPETKEPEMVTLLEIINRDV